MNNLIKYDKNNIPFIDDSDIQKKEVFLECQTYNYTPYSHFYTFGDSNYLVKVDYQKILFHDARTRRMIQEFQKRREFVLNVDLPIAYYQKDGKALGSIIYYYPQAPMLSDIYNCPIEKVSRYYLHDDNEKHNLLLLYLDMLKLLTEMYKAGICYMDVRGRNFVFYENDVKLIDFEPSQLHFHPNGLHQKKIVESFWRMIYALNKQYGFEIIPESKSFEEIEGNIKRLYRKK